MSWTLTVTWIGPGQGWRIACARSGGLSVEIVCELYADRDRIVRELLPFATPDPEYARPNYTDDAFYRAIRALEVNVCDYGHARVTHRPLAMRNATC